MIYSLKIDIDLESFDKKDLEKAIKKLASDINKGKIKIKSRPARFKDIIKEGEKHLFKNKKNEGLFKLYKNKQGAHYYENYYTKEKGEVRGRKWNIKDFYPVAII